MTIETPVMLRIEGKITSAFQVKHRATPKVLNSKAQGKVAAATVSREAPPWVRVAKNIIRTPTGFHLFGSASCVPRKTPLGFEFVSFRYPGCAGVPATAGLWSVTPSA